MKHILFFLLFTGFQTIMAQTMDTIPVTLYETTNDFIKNQKRDVNALAIVRQQSSNHIWIKKIIDAETGKKIKKATTSWAIEHEGDSYFNLDHSTDMHQPKAFIKLEIIGTYCAAFIDEHSASVIKSGGTNYGGVLGLAGVGVEVVVKESVKWNKSWKDQYNIKRKVLLINTMNVDEKRKNAEGNLLSRKQVKEFLGEKYAHLDAKELSFESIVALINKMNGS